MRETTSPEIIWRNALIKLFFASLLLFFITSSGRHYSIDGMKMYALTRSIVDNASFEINSGDGERYCRYGPLQSVAAIPLYALSKPITWLGRRFLNDELLELWNTWAVCLLNVFVTAASVVVMAVLAAELGVGFPGAIATSLIWGFATMALPYAKYDFSEPLLTFLIMLSILSCYRLSKNENLSYALLAGLFMGLSFLTKYANIMIAPVFLIVIAGSSSGRFRRIVAYSLPIVFCVMTSLLYNYIRFGNMMDTGYSANQLHELKARGRFIECVYGILFSGGKSIFVYSPPLLLAVIGIKDFLKKSPRNLSFALCALLSLIIYFVIYSQFTFWDGSMSYGPRYFLPFVAIGVWMSAPFVERAIKDGSRKWRKILLWSLVALGLFVQGIAVSVIFNSAYENGAVASCIHTWFSQIKGEEPRGPLPPICKKPLVREFENLKIRAPRMLRITASVLKGNGAGVDKNKKIEHTYLDFWAAYLVVKLPTWPARFLMVFVLLCFTIAFFLLFSVIQSVRHEDRIIKE